MKFIYFFILFSVTIYPLSKNNLINTNFLWDHCENWRNLNFYANGKYQLIESYLGAAPHIGNGVYRIEGNKVKLIPKSCTGMLKNPSAPENKEYAAILCARRFGYATCELKFVKGKDYRKVLTCSEDVKVPDADSTDLKILMFADYERVKDQFRNCIMPYPNTP